MSRGSIKTNSDIHSPLTESEKDIYYQNNKAPSANDGSIAEITSKSLDSLGEILGEHNISRMKKNVLLSQTEKALDEVNLRLSSLKLNPEDFLDERNNSYCKSIQNKLNNISSSVTALVEITNEPLVSLLPKNTNENFSSLIQLLSDESNNSDKEPPSRELLVRELKESGAYYLLTQK